MAINQRVLRRLRLPCEARAASGKKTIDRLRSERADDVDCSSRAARGRQSKDVHATGGARRHDLNVSSSPRPGNRVAPVADIILVVRVISVVGNPDIVSRPTRD